MYIEPCEVCGKSFFSDDKCDGDIRCINGSFKIKDLQRKNDLLMGQISSLKDSCVEVLTEIGEKQIPIDESILVEWWKKIELYPNIEKHPDVLFNFLIKKMAESGLVASVFKLFRKKSRGHIAGKTLTDKLREVYNNCEKLKKANGWESDSFNLTPEEAILYEGSDDNL